jgi:hypothetical protein
VHPAVPRGGIAAAQHRHINSKRGQDQRHPEQSQQRDSETTRPPARQLITRGDGEDQNQRAGDKKGRNLRLTVRSPCQPAGPRDLLAVDEFPAQLMKVTKAGPRVQSDRNQKRTARPECRQALQHGAALHASHAASAVLPATAQSHGDTRDSVNARSWQWLMARGRAATAKPPESGLSQTFEPCSRSPLRPVNSASSGAAAHFLIMNALGVPLSTGS